MPHTAHAREHLVEVAGIIVARERGGIFKVEIAETGRVVLARCWRRRRVAFRHDEHDEEMDRG